MWHKTRFWPPNDHVFIRYKMTMGEYEMQSQWFKCLTWKIIDRIAIINVVTIFYQKLVFVELLLNYSSPLLRDALRILTSISHRHLRFIGTVLGFKHFRPCSQDEHSRYNIMRIKLWKC